MAKDPGSPTPKVLKVRVRRRLHDQLHVARILTGRPIATIVQEALARYLRQQDASPRDDPPPMKARA